MPHWTAEISEDAKRRTIREIAVRLSGHSLEILFNAAAELGHGQAGKAEVIGAAELGHRAAVIAGKARTSLPRGERAVIVEGTDPALASATLRLMADALDAHFYALTAFPNHLLRFRPAAKIRLAPADAQAAREPVESERPRIAAA